MKVKNLKKFVSLLTMIIFVTSFATIAKSQTEGKMTTIEGQVTSVNPDTGEVVIESESGQMITLTPDSGIDANSFKVGDKVKMEVEYSGSSMTIQSITKNKD